MSVNQGHESTCPKCKQPMKPVKGEIYYFCPLCWNRLDTGSEVRSPRPHQKKAQGQTSEE